jgi:hypothetical protein
MHRYFRLLSFLQRGVASRSLPAQCVAALLIGPFATAYAADKSVLSRDIPPRTSIPASPGSDAVEKGAAVLTTRDPVVVMRGFPFSHAIQASGSVTRYGASGLPSGLSCDPQTGIISGVTSASGEFTVTLSATNAAGTNLATQVFIADGIAPIEMPLVKSVMPPPAGLYRSGDRIDITIEIDVPYSGLEVVGRPRITLLVGTQTRYASFESLTGSGDRARLVFTYTVAPGGVAASGIVVGSAIEQNGGTIRDRMGLYCALGLPEMKALDVRVGAAGGPNTDRQLALADAI